MARGVPGSRHPRSRNNLGRRSDIWNHLKVIATIPCTKVQLNNQPKPGLDSSMSQRRLHASQEGHIWAQSRRLHHSHSDESLDHKADTHSRSASLRTSTGFVGDYLSQLRPILPHTERGSRDGVRSALHLAVQLDSCSMLISALCLFLPLSPLLLYSSRINTLRIERNCCLKVPYFTTPTVSTTVSR